MQSGFRISLIVLMSLLVLPALATAAADDSVEAFLRSLAPSAPAAPADPLPGVGTPEPQPKSCSISRNCGDGNTVACTGTFSCVYSQKGVSCNGVEHACPNYCIMSWTCDDCPTYVTSCWSLKGDCGVTNSACDGRAQRCFCPEFPQQ